MKSISKEVRVLLSDFHPYYHTSPSPTHLAAHLGRVTIPRLFQSVLSMTPQNREMQVDMRPWSDLPMELLCLILSWLPYHPSFALVCKTWKSCTSLVYPADCCPLLIYCKKWDDGIFHYYSPFLNKTFLVDCPVDLSDSSFYFARDGWLLVYRSCEIILVNPITGVVHKGPDIENFYSYDAIAFEGTPPYDYTIFAIECGLSSVEISIAKCGKDQFVSNATYDSNQRFFMSSHCVPCHGRFYCLGRKGKLGVYDPMDDTWTVLNKAKLPITSCEEYFLVESEGELLAVLIGKHGTSIDVLKLNQVTVAWESIKSIGSQTLFVGSPASISSTTQSKRMKNRIYEARLHGAPEIIKAEMKCSEGRMFFVPKTYPSKDLRGDMSRASGANMCYYSLENGEHSEYLRSEEILCSIWFEP